MMNFFRAINNFLQACEDYLEYRVKTGKFITDIKYLNADFKRYEGKKERELENRVVRSHWLALTIRIGTQLRKIPILGDIFAIIFRTLRFCLFYFLESVVVLTLTFITFFALASFFDTASVLFSLLLIPGLFLTIIAFCSLYAFIDKQERHEKVTILDGIGACFKHLSSLFLLLCSHMFILLTIIALFFIFAFSVSFIFEFTNTPWENSFIFWMIVIPVLLIALFTMFTFFMVSYHAYYFVLLDEKKPLIALKNSWRYLRTYPLQNTFFFLIIFILFFPIFSWAYRSFFAFGIGMTIALLGQIFMLLTYLLRNIFLAEKGLEEKASPNFRYGFSLAFLIGAVTYFMGSILFIQHHNNIQEFLWEEEQKAALASELTQYYDEQYKYILNYPKRWTVYRWEDNTVSLYNNYSGSNEGGIWINISVRSDHNANFDVLRSSKPGLIEYNTGTQSIMTKVSDIALQGYPGVKYTYSLPRNPSPQYQIHYLIQKDENVYDIVFLTTSKSVQGNNLELFETIFNSFRFIDEESKAASQ